ncbi:transglutaminase family protein [Methanobacterium sp. SMA-27]|uniref:transglutaminase-like domain-containing protein n=1 Tax=Methanobacterium sp. SMA-27 TaxID=1495336 RepID=UPI000694545F|nr:transglutaminase domain-containing protein [Methanobacterium sp. SMA-27]
MFDLDQIFILFDFVKQGGGIINRKLLLSVLLFFSLALALNASTSSAASMDQKNISISNTSPDNLGNNICSSNYITGNANSTTKTNIKNTTTKKAKINSTMAAGAPVKVNGLTLAQLKGGTSRVQSFYNKNNRLPKYVTFGTRKISISTFKKNIATQGLKIKTKTISTKTVTTKKVNGLTVLQLKEGTYRVQSFYNKNGRLPKYVKFGTRKITMATFQENITTQGLKINTTRKTVKIDTSSVASLAKSLKAGSTSTYNTAVAIFNWVRDNINYSFYYNTRYGASGTLKNRSGNCVDTSHLLISLARSAGITARYVHGTCKFSSGTWYGHVWAQLYLNGKWVIADGTSYRNSLGVVKNWDTSTYKLNGIYTTLPF